MLNALQAQRCIGGCSRWGGVGHSQCSRGVVGYVYTFQIKDGAVRETTIAITNKVTKRMPVFCIALALVYMAF